MTTPLFLLRCVQLGLSMADLELLSIGLINDTVRAGMMIISMPNLQHRKTSTVSD